MNVLFRDLSRTDSPAPAPDELVLLPRDPQQRESRALARLACDRGVDSFVQGTDPIKRIVVQAQATFDDMLAALFAELLLTGQPLPPGAAALALYAELAREGLRPAPHIALEVSIEGIYLAIRNGAGENLVDPDVSRKFLVDWRRMAECLLQAAGAGTDPFQTAVFTGPNFARERTFLAHDGEVFRQDLARGERWRIRIPGGPAQSYGLLLRAPKSLLFKYWSRVAANALLPEPPLLVAVCWGRGDWVFSTDPVQRLSLKPLAELLQAAEAARDPARAARLPWFDGQPFKHTLAAAPREGTLLADDRVLAIVRGWAQARPIEPRLAGGVLPVNRRTLLASGSACALLAAAFGARKLWPGGSADDRGLLIVDEQDERAPAGPSPGSNFALLIATDEYEHWARLDNPIADATAIELVLQKKYGFRTELVKNPTVELINDKLGEQNHEWGPNDQLFVLLAGHGDFHPKTGAGYIVGRDTKKRRYDSAMQSYLSHALLRRNLETVPCNHLFVVIDVCFAGKFQVNLASLGSPEPRRRGDYHGPYAKVSKAEFIRRKMKPRCRRFLASCDELVTASDGLPGEHSPFARQLLESLNSGGGPDGILTSQDIVKAVEELQAQPTFGSLEGNQDGGEFLFISRQP